MNFLMPKPIVLLYYVLLVFLCGFICSQCKSSSPSPGESRSQTGKNGEGKLRAGDFTRTLRVGDLERRYRIYIPKNYDRNKATPVVVVYHGGGGNPESMIRLTGMNAKADEAGFIVVYPFGTGRLATEKDFSAEAKLQSFARWITRFRTG